MACRPRAAVVGRAPRAAVLRCSAGGSRRSASLLGRIRGRRPRGLGLEVRCMRSWRPFSCGEAGWMKCGSMPSLIHHADSRVRPPAPVRPNGEPLSLRMARGNPWRRTPPQRPAAILRSSAARSAPRSVATVAVGQRQRVDPAVVAGAEPALEIGRPLVIGGRNRRHRPPPIERRPTPDQPGPLEDITDRRSRRPAGLGPDAPAPLAACAVPNAGSGGAAK